jgi:hypothetical protein
MPLNMDKFQYFFFKWVPIHELVICFIALFVFNNYIKHSDQVIRADGLGYYNYLPAIFIYHDLNFEFTDTLQTEFYNHQEANAGILRSVNGKNVNKYFVGTALMQSPFFLGAHVTAKKNSTYSADGYSEIYQRGIYHAALVWTLIGLLFLRLSLQHLGLHKWWIFWIQAAVFFASSLPNYIVTDASFSHTYSFALISIWCYLILSFQREKPLKLLWIGLVLGIIVLIRPINIVVIGFLPFLVLVQEKPLKAVLCFFENKKMIFIALLTFLLVVFIQPLIWHIQSGHWIVSSYGEESFNFSNPHIIDFLFSYRKGFFVYAPIFFILLTLFTIQWVINQSWRTLISFYLPFLITIYVLSSWWYWSYGASYGSRVMIDFYPFIALASIGLYKHGKTLLLWLLTPIIIFFAYLALLQTYQYKNYILSWDEMNYTSFWTVFMQTDDKFKGYLWQEKFDPQWEKDILYSFSDASDNLEAEPLKVEFNIEKEYSRLAVIIKGNCSYKAGINRFMVAIDDSLGNNQYYHEQAIFKSTAKENYTGDFELAYFIKPLQKGWYKLVFVILKEEEMKCDDPIEIRLFGLY